VQSESWLDWWLADPMEQNWAGESVDCSVDSWDFHLVGKLVSRQDLHSAAK
jgi:hypothetical protein